MPKDESILTFMILARNPEDARVAQELVKESYSLRSSISRIMPSTKKPGWYIAYVDVFYPDGMTYLVKEG